MTGTRWLLVATMIAIIGTVGVAYRAQWKSLRERSPAKPQELPIDLRSSASDWHWERTEGKPPFRKSVEISAKNFKQIKETSQVQLEGVTLKLYHKDGEAYDLVKSPAATFHAGEKQMYADGEVEITLGVPKEGPAPPDLVWIKTSGVRFDSDSGKSETDRPTQFRFAKGEGKSVGAIYDPTVRSLELRKDVEIHWSEPGARPMMIQSGILQYYEAKQEIWVRGWGKLTRGTATIEGEDTVVHLKGGTVALVEAIRAHGADAQAKRRLDYQAEKLWVNFNDGGQVEKVIGDTQAQLISDGASARTRVNADHVEMEFTGGADAEATLAKVTANGKTEVESVPKAVKGRALAETHVLRSERVQMTMRPGGQEVEKVITEAPGVLEFLPNLPTHHRRTLEGTRMTIAYGADNHVEQFHATDAKTRTEPTAEEKKRNRQVAVTASKELKATFEAKSNRMALLEQWGDFVYDEGERKARAAKARMEGEQNVMVLETGARVWDATGSTVADRIRMDQRTGDFTAEGKVSTSRVPEKKAARAGPSGRSAVGEMLAGEEPLHAIAGKMDAKNRNRLIEYRGKVTLWQGANRITGDAVTVDREKRTLVADGNVVSHLWEQPKESTGDKKRSPAPPPVLTVVRAPHLRYTDEDRLAYYTGGVWLTRPGLDVKGRELRAWMSASGSESSLEKAFADGKVEIARASAGKTMNGSSEHAEFYTLDQRIILRGGEPQMVDSVRGRTRGSELTYYANDDRLLVNGVPDRPANTVIRKR
jgi:lipopolysaccharide export system protein LptA